MGRGRQAKVDTSHAGATRAEARKGQEGHAKDRKAMQRTGRPCKGQEGHAKARKQAACACTAAATHLHERGRRVGAVCARYALRLRQHIHQVVQRRLGQDDAHVGYGVQQRQVRPALQARTQPCTHAREDDAKVGDGVWQAQIHATLGAQAHTCTHCLHSMALASKGSCPETLWLRAETRAGLQLDGSLSPGKHSIWPIGCLA